MKERARDAPLFERRLHATPSPFHSRSRSLLQCAPPPSAGVGEGAGEGGCEDHGGSHGKKRHK